VRPTSLRPQLTRCPRPAPLPSRHRYWEEKGLAVAVVSRLLNLLALAFTVCMSAFLLLLVNWSGLRDECIRADTCDIWEVHRREGLRRRCQLWL
jgi:hypothetical protein